MNWQYVPGKDEGGMLGGGDLPAIMSPSSGGGFSYVGQFNRDEDAQLAAAAPEMADALEAIRAHELAAAHEMRDGGYEPPELPWMPQLNAALRKAGR